MFPEAKQGNHKSDNFYRSRFVSYFTVFLKVLRISQHVFRELPDPRTSATKPRRGPVFSGCLERFASFRSREKGPKRPIFRTSRWASYRLLSREAPDGRFVSYFTMFSAYGCRFVSYFTVFWPPPVPNLKPNIKLHRKLRYILHFDVVLHRNLQCFVVPPGASTGVVLLNGFIVCICVCLSDSIRLMSV